MEKRIEAEGGELILRNKNGSVAIIPAKHRQEVLGMLKDGCTNCINDYISKLPKHTDIAKEGTQIPSTTPGIQGHISYKYGGTVPASGNPPTKRPTITPEGEVVHESKNKYTQEDLYPWETLADDGSLKTDITKLPNLPMDNKFQPYNTWMRNWIRQRPNQLANFTNNPNKLLDQTMLNLGTVKFRDYAYIRPDSQVPFTDGSYNPRLHSIYFPTKYTNLPTVIHELGHASKLETNSKIQDYINKVISTDSKLRDFKHREKNYFSSPNEIYSRIWELRKTLDYKPGDIIKKEDLKTRYKLSKYKNDLFDYLNDETIVTLMNDLVSTAKQTNQV